MLSFVWNSQFKINLKFIEDFGLRYLPTYLPTQK